MSDLVKIWSFEHDAWWRPNSQGYTTHEEAAGLYPRAEAEEICRRANYGGVLNEDIVEVNTPPLRDQIGALIREINEQDNRATASPYYFVVQSKVWKPTAEEYASGEGKLVTDDDCAALTKEEWLRADPDRTEEQWDELDHFWLEFEWEDREIFLTETAANQFIKAQAHHLNEPRTYVKYFWRNSQMELVFKALEEFSGQQIKRR